MKSKITVEYSPYMMFSICSECNFTEDDVDDQPLLVCPDCGSVKIFQQVGRWKQTSEIKSGVWNSVLNYFLARLPTIDFTFEPKQDNGKTDDRSYPTYRCY